jgi:DNA adenine methylase
VNASSPHFIRWPGGKKWIAPVVADIAKHSGYARYIEPFAGSAAVFFELRPEVAILGDVIPDLITTYQAVRDDALRVAGSLRRLRVSRDEYYRIRASRPILPHTIAARFIYLNRTGFNGLYRENREGAFTIPYGGGDRSPKQLLKDRRLEEAAVVLKGADITFSDFELTMRTAKEGDFVYCDPPYTAKHNNNGFRRYNESIFSWSDQVRLHKAARAAARRGATVVVSNANHAELIGLYEGCRVAEVVRRTAVGAANRSRAMVEEVLIRVK